MKNAKLTKKFNLTNYVSLQQARENCYKWKLSPFVILSIRKFAINININYLWFFTRKKWNSTNKNWTTHFTVAQQFTYAFLFSHSSWFNLSSAFILIFRIFISFLTFPISEEKSFQRRQEVKAHHHILRWNWKLCETMLERKKRLKSFAFERRV